MAFDGLRIMFLTGSLDVYSDETLRLVSEQSTRIVEGLWAASAIPVEIVEDTHAAPPGCHPPGLPGCQRRRPLHRGHRLDAHLQPGQDVDRRSAGPPEAAAPPAHAIRARPALVEHRHGLHEPQPVGARRPRVRLHRHAAAPSPQDGRGPLAGPGRAGPYRCLGAGRGRRARGPAPQGLPLRRQHAPRRGYRGRQDRGAGQAGHRLQHVCGQRSRAGRR